VTWRDQSPLKAERGKSHWATVSLSTSGFGLSATSLDVRCLIAIWGKADQAQTGQNRRS
jgi:hypothetical protein